MSRVQSVAREGMRADGRMCRECSRPLDLGVGAVAWKGGLRSCDRCERPRTLALRFKVERGIWCVEFLDPRSRFPVAPCRRFQDEEKIRELIRRTPSRFNLADKQALDVGLSRGMGELDIQVTADQLRKLQGK